MSGKLASVVRELWDIPLDEVKVLRRKDHISYADVERKVLVGYAGKTRYMVKLAKVEHVDLDRLYRVARDAGMPTIPPVPSRAGRMAVRLGNRFLMVFPWEELGACRDTRRMEEALLAFHRLPVGEELIVARSENAADVVLKLERHPEAVAILRRTFPDLDVLAPRLGALLDGGEAPRVIHGSPWVGNFFEHGDRCVLIDFDSVRLGDPRFDLVRLVETYPLLVDDPDEARRLGEATIARLAGELPDRFGGGDLRAFFLASSVLALDTEPRFLEQYLAKLEASGLIPGVGS